LPIRTTLCLSTTSPSEKKPAAAALDAREPGAVAQAARVLEQELAYEFPLCADRSRITSETVFIVPAGVRCTLAESRDEHMRLPWLP
jgi:hypothetical protein